MCSTQRQTVSCLNTVSVTLPPAHSLLAISSCSYLWETMPGLWCLLFRRDTVSAASRRLKEGTFSPEWSHTCYKIYIFPSAWRQNNQKKKQDKAIALECWALVIWWIMFISFSLKQVVDNLWRITFWIISALSEVVWNGFTVRLSAVDAISYKMEKSFKLYACIYIYLGNGHIWSKQQAEDDSAPAFQHYKPSVSSSVEKFIITWQLSRLHPLFNAWNVAESFGKTK